MGFLSKLANLFQPESNARGPRSGLASANSSSSKFKPVPIIGPDGREIPRPRDAEGRPLPIYSTEDGKPYLDKMGRPVVVVFDKKGKPIPYPPWRKPLNVPKWLVVMGFVDLFLCLIVAGIAGFFLSRKPSPPETISLGVTIGVALFGSLADLCPLFAIKTDIKCFLYTWLALVILLLMVQAGVTIFSQEYVSLGASVHCFLRAVIIAIIFCVLYFGKDDDEDQEEAPPNQPQPPPHQQPHHMGPNNNTGFYGGIYYGGGIGGWNAGSLAMSASIGYPHYQGSGYGFDGGHFM